MIDMGDDNANEPNHAEWMYNPSDQTGVVVGSDVANTEPTTEPQLQITQPEAKGDPIDEAKDDKTQYSWQGVDSIAEDKKTKWYLILIGGTVLCSAIIYFITRDKITTGVILVCGLVLGFYAAKRPRTVNYILDDDGIKVNERYYSFNKYRSFSILRRGDNITAILVPLKRLMPYMYINFTTEREAMITDTLADLLPQEMVRIDLLDRVLHSIGF
jgi:hypothetical protein